MKNWLRRTTGRLRCPGIILATCAGREFPRHLRPYQLPTDSADEFFVDRATFPSDTISTQYIWLSGTACLNRWGLLDRLRATGSSPGILDAFRSAEWLEDAIHEGLSGARPLNDALAEYHRKRDEHLRAAYELTCGLATMNNLRAVNRILCLRPRFLFGKLFISLQTP